MMELPDDDNTEDYLWYLQTSIADDEEWKERRYGIDYDADPTAISVEEKQKKILYSLIPDEVLYNFEDYSLRQFNCCLLFGDVSGFTDLCERYNKLGRGGPSKITQILNTYIGAMVQEILAYQGDLLNFSGDSFLALWKEDDTNAIRDLVHEALDCALVIQKTYGIYKTDIDIFVRVKLAIAAGNINFCLVGDASNSTYLSSGPCLWDLRSAARLSSAGEVIISYVVYKFLNADEYLLEKLSDGIHYKVYGVGPNWRSMQRNLLGTNRESVYGQYEFSEEESEGSLSTFQQQSRTKRKIPPKDEEYLLRPAIKRFSQIKGMKQKLRRFIIKPVMNAIDSEEPLEYLSEMRQVVVLFSNIILDSRINAKTVLLISDNIYRTIARKVNSMNGTICAFNNFDKDLMMLVVFGLRGTKHELEAQYALTCASLIKKEVANIENVTSVSIGITTGNTYFGVFGYSLRREYTVISLTVNKAARLMIAYANKITCDRETFLKSNLELINFRLQAPQPLKGIANPGPIYEFIEAKLDHGTAKINPYPLLGRDDEITLYFHLLKNFTTKDKNKNGKSVTINTLFIKGEARQGKTRLLEELVFVSPPDVKVVKVFLNKYDANQKFQGIRLIIFLSMGLEVDQEFEDNQVENILSKLLKKEYDSSKLCFINDLFMVKFDYSDMYGKLNPKNKKQMRTKIFKYLCNEVFKTSTTTVLMIDNVQYIDYSSWELLLILINLNLVFIVATCASNYSIDRQTWNAFTDTNHVVKIKLGSIDKWYHGGLACQMINVIAIPPELEQMLHKNSNGNPGWIEGFLISSLQSRGIFIEALPRKSALEEGYVFPPIYMIRRMSTKDTELYKKLSEDRATDPSFEVDKVLDKKWQIFVDPARQSFSNFVENEVFKRYYNMEAAIFIGKLNPSFDVNAVDPYLSLGTLILKTFDSLTPYEQQLLKCSSVLGEVFLREMLLYIYPSENTYKTATAVQKLFECRILDCAKGDFINSDIKTNLIKRIDPDKNAEIVCHCVGLKIPVLYKTLPKYAFCGYLRFRWPEFRETIYNLLTEFQKSDLHEKSIRYLEKETRKCQHCGRGFMELFPQNSKYLSYLIHASHVTNVVKTQMANYSLDKLSLGSSRPKNKSEIHREWMQIEQVDMSNTSIYVDPKKKKFLETLMSENIGFRIVKKFGEDLQLTRTFSNTSFVYCQCPQIMSSVYERMLYHLSGSKNYLKQVDLIIEYAYLCIDTYNYVKMVNILEEAHKLLDGPLRKQFEMDWEYFNYKGKICTLEGKLFLKQCQWIDAYNKLNEAFKFFDIKYPNICVTKKMLMMNLEMKQKCFLYLLPNAFNGRVSGVDAQFFDNVAEALNGFTDLYIYLNKWEDAKLTALWAFDNVIKSYMNYRRLTKAFVRMMTVLNHFHQTTWCKALEVYGLKICYLKNNIDNVFEMNCTSEIYYCTFIQRILRGEISKGIDIGYILWKMATSFNSISIIQNVLPNLAISLLLRLEINSVKAVIQEIEFYCIQYGSISIGKFYYYLITTIFQLETGCTLEHYNKCVAYALTDGHELSFKNIEVIKMYNVIMWLWCLRSRNISEASLYKDSALQFQLIKNEPFTIFISLYLLECLLLSVASPITGILEMSMMHKKIDDMFRDLTKMSSKILLIKPRLLHYKAFHCSIQEKDMSTSFSHLGRAKKISKKIGNLLDTSWIEYSDLVWQHAIPVIKKTLWIDLCDENKQLTFQKFIDEYHEIPIHYTLEARMNLWDKPIIL